MLEESTFFKDDICREVLEKYNIQVDKIETSRKKISFNWVIQPSIQACQIVKREIETEIQRRDFLPKGKKFWENQSGSFHYSETGRKLDNYYNF